MRAHLPSTPRPLRPLLLLLPALALAGCLFDEAPACAIGGSACPGDRVCDPVSRRCLDPGVAPDGAGADRALPDQSPADAAPPDRALPDAEPDRALPDAALPDAEPSDADPPCRPVAERCNGRDDDCDGTVDEEAPRCDIPANCHWRHRAHHSYLFCDGAVSQAEALALCTQTLDLAMAVPETCDESDWLFATGNLTPSPVVWERNARGRAWWLGLSLPIADQREKIERIDRRPLPVPIDCWMTGEPDVAIQGENCVDLLYNLNRDDWGWNDDACAFNAENPVNALCEVPCAAGVDADGDGEDACIDCDDTDPDANSDEGIDGCALAPEAGLPP